ncbi:MAG: hypothetical protein HRU08_10875 [Oleispira sp.]|nr:hypothetical protein [Oleispira sp.]
MWGQNKYRMIKDIVPTMLISGHQNLKRLINWPTWDAPHARIHAHNMLHYYNKILGDCPNINMVEKMPFLKLDELNLHKDWQACWINNRQGKSIPVKRFVCTADSNDGNLNCAKQNVIAHDYANGNTFTKEKAIFPINQCTSSGSGSRKTTTCHAGHWRLSGIEGEAGNNGHLKFQIELPAGAKNVEIYLTPLNGNSGDADLYVKKGLEQASTSNYDCLSLNYDAAETCSMGDDPKGGIYNILVSRWTNYDNYRLTVVYKQYF